MTMALAPFLGIANGTVTDAGNARETPADPNCQECVASAGRPVAGITATFCGALISLFQGQSVE